MGTVLIDCGNSTIRVAWLADDGGLDEPSIVGDDFAFRAWLADRPARGARLVWSNPLGGRLARDWCDGVGLVVEVVGEELAVPHLGQYDGCGADRVLAGLACCGSAPGIVIDAGTATTLTAWRHAEGRPSFAGGLILPGAEACRRGLQHLVPRLPHAPMDWQADGRAAQQDTVGALQAALAIGYPAMVRGCLERLAADTGLAQVTITGGAGEALQRHLPDADLLPHAVLRGLAQL